MKKGVRTTLVVSTFCLLALVFLVIRELNAKRIGQLTCAGVKVEFTDDFNFVTAKDIEGYLKEEYGAYIGQRLDSVDLARVEKILDGKSAILKTEAYTSPDGFLNVKVRQREPAVRFQKDNNGFYSDEKGFLFPLQHNYTSMVPIIDGDLPLNVERGYKGRPKTDIEKEWLAEVIDLVNYIQKSGIWAENISQITVSSNGDLIMIPREGKERFIFGPPTDFDGKFDRISRYYTTILPEKGAGCYSTVNVKYNGQIVCRK
jgi:cell division protein FtsQ